MLPLVFYLMNLYRDKLISLIYFFLALSALQVINTWKYISTTSLILNDIYEKQLNENQVILNPNLHLTIEKNSAVRIDA